MAKLYGVLMIVIMTIVVSAIINANTDTLVQYAYAQSPHEVTLLNSSTVTTPAPFVSPALQAQLIGLMPFGVLIGGAFAVFVLYFRRGR